MTTPNPPPPATEAAAPRAFPWAELLTAGGYLLLGATWIIVSDQVVARWQQQPPGSTLHQTLKGLNFVITTAGILYLVLRHSHGRRRKAEQQARIDAERFACVARATTDAMWDWDLRADTIWWSRGFSTLFGYAAGEWEPTLGFWTEQLHPEDRDRVVTGLQTAVDRPGLMWSDEYRFRRKDGTYAHVSDRGYVVRDPGGRALRMIGGMSDITARREAEEALRRSGHQLRALSARLESLREEERTRISREIHDELGQLLTALRMSLRWIEDRLSEGSWPPAANAVVDRVVDATDLTDRVLTSVRRIAADLRPDALDSLGLLTALRFEAERFQQQHGVTCQVDLPEQMPPLPAEARTAVFRIFQEALTNVARHSGASSVQAQLRIRGAAAELEVHDNGRGLSMETLSATESLGLLGMQERARLLEGEVSLLPGQAGGTTVHLRFPLPSPSPS